MQSETETLRPVNPVPGEGPRWSDWLQRLSALGGLIFVTALFSILRPRTFPTLGNLQLMLIQTSVVATAALGMTLIIVSGGIDLSVGSTIACVTMVVALLLNWRWPPLLAALGGVAAAGAYGLVIGVLVGKAKLIPFVVTLGTWSAYRGIAKAIGDESVINTEATWLGDLMLNPGGSLHWVALAPGVWITLGLALLVAGVMRYTRFGRHVFAVGSNEQTARLCGVAVDRVKILVYTIAGLLAGVAGVLQFSYISQGDPTTANGMELSIIAAVVIGGASLSGGQGTILGTLIGAMIMTILGNGCVKLGLRNNVQEILTGAIIVVAHGLDRLQHRTQE
jgi:ribose/xylose/arabinose/galactoside ABC-type transport system permease subunit